MGRTSIMTGLYRKPVAWDVPREEPKVSLRAASEKDWGEVRRAALIMATVVCWIAGVPLQRQVQLAHPQSSNVTWSDEVRPILERRCASCHGSGRTAAPALSTYREAALAAGRIKRSVLERTMPPWNVAPGFGIFSNDRALPSHERDLLVSWVDGGRMEGPAHSELAGHSGPLSHGEFHADLVLDVGREHVIDSTRTRYRVATSLPNDRWIAGWHFRPGNEALVRRARVSLESGALLGVWLPDEEPAFFPSPLAERLPAGSAMILEVEYVEPAGPAHDRSAVGLYFARQAGTPLQHLTLRRGTTALQEDMRVVALTPALEMVDQSARVVATRPDQSVEPLMWVRKYDPRFARTYRLQQPVDLPRGTRIDVWSFDAECSVDLTYASDVRAGVTVPKARPTPPR